MLQQLRLYSEKEQSEIRKYFYYFSDSQVLEKSPLKAYNDIWMDIDDTSELEVTAEEYQQLVKEEQERRGLLCVERPMCSRRSSCVKCWVHNEDAAWDC